MEKYNYFFLYIFSFTAYYYICVTFFKLFNSFFQTYNYRYFVPYFKAKALKLREIKDKLMSICGGKCQHRKSTEILGCEGRFGVAGQKRVCRGTFYTFQLYFLIPLLLLFPYPILSYKIIRYFQFSVDISLLTEQNEFCILGKLICAMLYSFRLFFCPIPYPSNTLSQCRNRWYYIIQ